MANADVIAGQGALSRRGCYRRATRIIVDAGRACVEMEDDVHHFELVLEHDGRRIKRVDGKALRTPWVSCPGALAQLHALIGLTLDDVRTLPPADRDEQCLHLFDLAVLAAEHAAESGFRRLYQVQADHDASPPALRMWCDGRVVLAWQVDGAIVRGSRFDGLPMAQLSRGFGEISRDDREAAILLRRASLISYVRRMNLDMLPDAGTSNPRSPANCYAKQPVRLGEAKRNFGSTRDFWGGDTWPLGSSSPIPND